MRPAEENHRSTLGDGGLACALVGGAELVDAGFGLDLLDGAAEGPGVCGEVHPEVGPGSRAARIGQQVVASLGALTGLEPMMPSGPPYKGC